MSKKLSSYQKLKLELARVKAENEILLDGTDFVAITGLKMNHRTKKDIQEMGMYGSRTGLGNGVLGLMNSMSEAEFKKEYPLDGFKIEKEEVTRMPDAKKNHNYFMGKGLYSYINRLTETHGELVFISGESNKGAFSELKSTIDVALDKEYERYANLINVSAVFDEPQTEDEIEKCKDMYYYWKHYVSYENKPDFTEDEFNQIVRQKLEYMKGSGSGVFFTLGQRRFGYEFPK